MASRAERLKNHSNGAAPVSEPDPLVVLAPPATPPKAEPAPAPEAPRKRPLAEKLGLVRPPLWVQHTLAIRAEMLEAQKKQRQQRLDAAPKRPKKQEAADQEAIGDAEDNLVAALRRIVHGDDAPLDKRNHLTLVELRYLMQLGRVPRAAWEPIAFLYMEGVKFRKWGFSFQRHYIESLLLTSQSVDGYRSDQLTRSLISEQTAKNNAAAGLRSPSGAQSNDVGAGRP